MELSKLKVGESVVAADFNVEHWLKTVKQIEDHAHSLTDFRRIRDQIQRLQGIVAGQLIGDHAKHPDIAKLAKAVKEAVDRLTPKMQAAEKAYNEEFDKKHAKATAGETKEAVFSKKFHSLTYWTSRNTSTSVNCESAAHAEALIKKSGVEQKLKTVAMKLPSHTKDVLIHITIEDVVIALQSNTQDRSPEAAHKEYKEILKYAMADAEHLLNENMKMILKEAGK